MTRLHATWRHAEPSIDGIAAMLASRRLDAPNDPCFLNLTGRVPIPASPERHPSGSGRCGSVLTATRRYTRPLQHPSTARPSAA
jgi:hypothetical protein